MVKKVEKGSSSKASSSGGGGGGVKGGVTKKKEKDGERQHDFQMNIFLFKNTFAIVLYLMTLMMWYINHLVNTF